MPQSSTQSFKDVDFAEVERRLWGNLPTLAETTLKEILDMEVSARAALACKHYVPKFEEFDCAIRKSCK